MDDLKFVYSQKQLYLDNIFVRFTAGIPRVWEESVSPGRRFSRVSLLSRGWFAGAAILLWVLVADAWPSSAWATPSWPLSSPASPPLLWSWSTVSLI